MCDESDEIDRRDGVFLPVTAPGAGIERLGSIEDAAPEEVRLMVALDLDNESGPVIPRHRRSRRTLLLNGENCGSSVEEYVMDLTFL